MPNFEKGETQASWNSWHKRRKHDMLTSRLIVKKWRAMKNKNTSVWLWTPIISNKATYGLFIIHASQPMLKMCNMIRMVQDERNKWQNEILPWWRYKRIYATFNQQISEERHMEVTNVVSYPNTIDYRVVIPNMISVTMQTLKMVRWYQTKMWFLILHRDI